jgi:SAM-dependent methyltransferase
MVRMARCYCILAPMTRRRDRCSAAEAAAGCREHFVDADLYDYEYRHRRADINFYRQLARNRMEFAPGAILDLACGSGRLLVPLARDGHQVVGIDRSPQMLAAAAQRIRRLSLSRRQQCTLVRADLRAFALRRPATLAISAFHSVQHLLTDEDFLRFLRCTHAGLMKGGWLAFDMLPSDPAWLARDSQRRWGRTTLRHPSTKQRFVYTSNHVHDQATRLLHMRLYYQPVDESGQPSGRERTVRLCHRQFSSGEIARMLRLARFRPIEVFGGFDGRPAAGDPGQNDEQVYVAVAL